MSKKTLKSKKKRIAANKRGVKRAMRAKHTAETKYKRTAKIREKKVAEQRKFQIYMEKLLASRQED